MSRKNNVYGIAQLSPVRYNHITLELRTNLINMVTSQGLSVYRAAKDLNINNSTAKVIIRNYRRRGHIYKRKSQRNNPKKCIETKMEGPNYQLQNQRSVFETSNMETHKLGLWRQPIWNNPPTIPCMSYPVYYLDQFSFGFGV